MSLISIKKAAEFAWTEPNVIRQWMHNGKIPASMIEHKHRHPHLKRRAFLEDNTVVISFFNRKGGVGKTVMAILTADYYAKKGKKVLVLDLDSQANITNSYLDFDLERVTFLDFLSRNKDLQKTILQSAIENVDIIAAHEDMDKFMNLDFSYWFEHLKVFQKVLSGYDIVVIDCPPSLTTYSRLGYMLSHYAIAPVLPTSYSSMGLFRMRTNTSHFTLPSNQALLGVINEFSKKTSETNKMHTQNIEEFLKDRLLKKRIPHRDFIEMRTAMHFNIFDLTTPSKLKPVLDLCNELDSKIFDGGDGDGSDLEEGN